jgi:glucose/mannose-6-phosphate isomerase
MLEDLKNFADQFVWAPKIINKKNYKPAKKIIVLGMGGSNHATELLQAQTDLNIIAHRNYGLPKLSDKELKEFLIIADSYSGNTEEVIDGLKVALNKKLNILVIATGGKLIKLAKTKNLAYIQIPGQGGQPRLGLGWQTRALLKAVNLTQNLKETEVLAKSLKSIKYQNQGKKLASKLKNKIPVIYASDYNRPLAYNWKIKFNENTKIPAFYNVFPELNHNEMNGFDVINATRKLSADFYFIFLEDKTDPPRVQKRMQITKKLYRSKKLPVITLPLKNQSVWHKIFSNLILADWTSYYLAKNYGIDPEPVPMVEKFKKLIK